MKICRRSIIVCIIISFVGLIVAGSLMSVPNCYIANAFQNLFIGIFSSAFVVLITLIIEYFVLKKDIISKTKIYCKDYLIEFENLLPQILVCGNQNEAGLDFDNVEFELKNNDEISQSVQRLMEIYENYIFNVDGFYPFIKRAKTNLIVHQMFCNLVKLHKTVLYFNFLFLKNHNEPFDIIAFPKEKTKDEFKNMILAVLSENGLYESLRTNYDNSVKIFPGKTIDNLNLNKCL